MTNSAIIHFTDNQTEFVWLTRQGHSWQNQAPSSLEYIQTQLPPKTKLTVFIPTVKCIATEVSLNAPNAARLRQAIPYALEEQLAENINDLHFAIGSTVNNKTPVIVINKAVLTNYLDRFAKQKLHVDSIAPDFYLLPYQPDTWTLSINERDAVIRTNQHTGFAIDKTQLEHQLQQAITQANDKPNQLIVYHSGQLQLPELTIPVTYKQTLSYQPTPCINLLQADFNQQEYVTLTKKRWRKTAALALLTLSIALVINTVEMFYYKNQKQKIQSAIEKIYFKQFPEAKQVVAPRNRFQQKLSEQNQEQTKDSFLYLITQVGNAIKQSKQQIQFDKISYLSGQIKLVTSVSDDDKLSGFTSHIEENGLKITQQIHDDNVEITIQVVES